MREPSMKTVGRRRIESSEAAAHDLQRAATQFVGPEGVCDRGLFLFESFEEADRWLMEQRIRRARGRRSLPTSRE